jgi:hypothetical protein
MIDDSLKCKCESPSPMRYGRFNPSAWVCGKCGLNLTERMEGNLGGTVYAVFPSKQDKADWYDNVMNGVWYPPNVDLVISETQPDNSILIGHFEKAADKLLSWWYVEEYQQIVPSDEWIVKHRPVDLEWPHESFLHSATAVKMSISQTVSAMAERFGLSAYQASRLVKQFVEKTK